MSDHDVHFPTAFGPFAEANDDDSEAGAKDYVHVYLQQKNGYLTHGGQRINVSNFLVQILIMLLPLAGSPAVHKEHEMEIGYPTDAKHVAHIDFDPPKELQTASAIFMDHRLPRMPKAAPSKTKQKKNKVASPTSSARSSRSSTSRASYSTAMEDGGEITGSQECSLYRS
ncbi:hypothetical protein OPV22_000961 [Ensete ventricosum]|uniref:CRIB domain-containing protein n=1 Tax=Ensete ventricosum TaxID=4639 RepID=A0AAV8RTV3_ENSVE|nr:hypothetical protein OPV22_000961 [Ensete ventricosum]